MNKLEYLVDLTEKVEHTKQLIKHVEAAITEIDAAIDSLKDTDPLVDTLSEEYVSLSRISTKLQLKLNELERKQLIFDLNSLLAD